MKTTRFELARCPGPRQLACFRCDQPLTIGERYIAAWPMARVSKCPAIRPWLDDQRRRAWYHLGCALDVSQKELTWMLRTAPDDEELEALRELARARTKAINATKRARKGAVFKAQSVDAVEASRDPSGRPRVTIAYFGSLASAPDGEATPLHDFARDDTIRTARREYIFDVFSGDDVIHLACDPSRPLVGAVFAAYAHTKVVKLQRDKLAILRTFGVRTPVLWLFGPELADAAVRDAKVLELREALDGAGFAGDEAAVVCSPDNRADVLEELGRALDELEARDAAPLRLTDRLERSIGALEGAIAERAEHQLAMLIEALPPASWTDDALRARAVRAVTASLGFASARDLALDRLIRWAADESKPAVLAMTRAALREPGRTMPSVLTIAFNWIGVPRVDPLYPVWAEAIVHEANAPWRRYEVLLEALEPCSDAEIGERLSSWSASLPARDRRKPSAMALAEKIVSNAATSPRSRGKGASRKAAPPAPERGPVSD